PPPCAASGETSRVVARTASPNTRTMMHSLGRGADRPVAVERSRTSLHAARGRAGVELEAGRTPGASAPAAAARRPAAGPAPRPPAGWSFTFRGDGVWLRV